MLLVISRFNEKLDWLSEINCEKVIYNKGKPLDGFINIPNIGRETETYLKYIVENYNKLPEIIIFTQADPFTHSPNFLKLIKNLDFSDILPLTVRWKPDFPPKLIYEKFLDSYYLETISKFTLAPLKHWDSGIADPYYKYINMHNLNIGTDVIKHFCDSIGLIDDSQDIISFFYSSCFAIKKETILKYNLDFYSNCLKIIRKNDNYGYLFERIWWKMFK